MNSKRRYGRKAKFSAPPVYSKRNYQLFGLAFFIIFIGYYALKQGPVDGVLTMTVAPILLVLGYCVVIPLAIIYSAKNKTNDHNSAD